MSNLVGAEVFKLRTTRLYLGFLVAAVAMVVFVTGVQFLVGDDAALSIEGAATAVQTEEDLRSILNVSGVAALFTLVLGATAVAGEYRHGTIVSTFLSRPRRAQVVVAKMFAYLLAGAVFGVVVEAAALVVSVIALGVTATPIPVGASVAAGLALTPLATGLAAAFGVGISAAIPNQLGAVLVAIGWVMVAEQLVAGLVPDVARWLPFSGANTAITGAHPDLGVTGGLLLSVGYLVAVGGVGVQLIRRRDVA